MTQENKQHLLALYGCWLWLYSWLWWPAFMLMPIYWMDCGGIRGWLFEKIVQGYGCGRNPWWDPPGSDKWKIGKPVIIEVPE